MVTLVRPFFDKVKDALRDGNLFLVSNGRGTGLARAEPREFSSGDSVPAQAQVQPTFGG